MKEQILSAQCEKWKKIEKLEIDWAEARKNAKKLIEAVLDCATLLLLFPELSEGKSFSNIFSQCIRAGKEKHWDSDSRKNKIKLKEKLSYSV